MEGQAETAGMTAVQCEYNNIFILPRNMNKNDVSWQSFSLLLGLLAGLLLLLVVIVLLLALELLIVLAVLISVVELLLLLDLVAVDVLLVDDLEALDAAWGVGYVSKRVER